MTKMQNRKNRNIVKKLNMEKNIYFAVKAIPSLGNNQRNNTFPGEVYLICYLTSSIPSKYYQSDIYF